MKTLQIPLPYIEPRFAENDVLHYTLSLYQNDSARRYHDVWHVKHMLAVLKAYWGTTLNKGSLERLVTAIVYHDVIYIPGATNRLNELASAELYAYHSRSLDPEFNKLEDPIYNAILATVVENHISAAYEPRTEFDAILLDCDLNSLSIPQYEVFEATQARVLEEQIGFATMDLTVARDKQAKFLHNFLQKPKIYHTDFAHMHGMEQVARTNISEFLKRHLINY